MRRSERLTFFAVGMTLMCLCQAPCGGRDRLFDRGSGGGGLADGVEHHEVVDDAVVAHAVVRTPASVSLRA